MHTSYILWHILSSLRGIGEGRGVGGLSPFPSPDVFFQIIILGLWLDSRASLLVTSNVHAQWLSVVTIEAGVETRDGR